MAKRRVDIDDELLKEAAEVLGTSTVDDTVNAAMREVAKAAQRRAITAEDFKRFAKATEDLRDPEVMARAYR